MKFKNVLLLPVLVLLEFCTHGTYPPKLQDALLKFSFKWRVWGVTSADPTYTRAVTRTRRKLTWRSVPHRTPPTESSRETPFTAGKPCKNVTRPYQRSQISQSLIFSGILGKGQDSDDKGMRPDAQGRGVQKVFIGGCGGEELRLLEGGMQRGHENRAEGEPRLPHSCATHTVFFSAINRKRVFIVYYNMIRFVINCFSRSALKRGHVSVPREFPWFVACGKFESSRRRPLRMCGISFNWIHAEADQTEWDAPSAGFSGRF